MGVHHHAHTARKKWTHYLWEFLMLFLAVFCGFLAEYQLEHVIEHQRTKELARSFYFELYSDSVSLEKKVGVRLTKEKSLIYIRHYIDDNDLRHPSDEFIISFYNGLYRHSASLFESKDIILEQMKNSGALRYFKNETFQKKIGDLSVAISNIRQRNEKEEMFRDQYIIPFLLKHYNQNWNDQLTNNDQLTLDEAAAEYEKLNKHLTGEINNLQQLNKGETINMIIYYRQLIKNTRQIHYEFYDSLNRELLSMLRKEYHIK